MLLKFRGAMAGEFGRADTGPPSCSQKIRRLSHFLGGGSLVECGIRQLKGLYRRLSFEHIRKTLQHFWIRRAAISLRVLFRVPEAVGDRFRAFGGDKGGLTAESLLLAQDWDDLILDDRGKLCGRIGLQLQSDLSSKHCFAPRLVSCGLQIVWIIPEELRRE